jgi:hypothetical protein
MKPTRKIGRSRSSLRAIQPSSKTEQPVQLESALERDFCCLLEFDTNVANYVEQPVIIKYSLQGHTRRYTPDFLIYYKDAKPAVLAEIKYQADLYANQSEYKLKFDAAREYASAQGWEFCIYTEAEIRTIYLKNAKFLLHFRNLEIVSHLEHVQKMLIMMDHLEKTTPKELLAQIFSNNNNHANSIKLLWCLVEKGFIGCNLLQPITMESTIWKIDGALSFSKHGQN